ncbi:MAG: ankyrin repeat domain-containing protein, partial [Planctomycetes bacterium]|nr:ankyrin repeat domain-containing protein [Planctomycetota bacterium]
MTHKGLLALALAAGLTAAAAVEPVPATTPADQEAERLFLEISRRDFAAAKALLAAHPDINLKYSPHPDGDFSIMATAAASGDPELVRQLLARGGDPRHPNNAPLAWAAFDNSHEIIRMLVAAGADVNGDWMRAPRGTAPIFSATTPETLELLLSLGADIEHRDLRTGKTPLHGSFDHADVTAALLRHGAKVDSLDHDGHTPLFEAVFWFHPECLADPKNSWHQESLNALRTIDLLIAHGADVNRQDYKGNTALHYAAMRYHPPLFAKLLAAGAQIDVPNHGGWTPLMWAAEEPGGAQAVARLLELGADPGRRTQDGET